MAPGDAAGEAGDRGGQSGVERAAHGPGLPVHPTSWHAPCQHTSGSPREALTSPPSVAPRRSQSVLPVIEPPACPPVDLRVSVWSPRAAAPPGHTGAATNAPLLGIMKRRLCKPPPLAPGAQTRLSRSRGAPNGHEVTRRSPGPGQRAKEPREQVSVHTRCSRLQYLHQRRWGASPQPSGREVLMPVRLQRGRFVLSNWVRYTIKTM